MTSSTVRRNTLDKESCDLEVLGKAKGVPWQPEPGTPRKGLTIRRKIPDEVVGGGPAIPPPMLEEQGRTIGHVMLRRIDFEEAGGHTRLFRVRVHVSW